MGEPEKQAHNVSWTTENELEFLKKLGGHSKEVAASPRPVLLRKYLKAMDLRVKWAGINAATIRTYILGELGAQA